MKPTRPPARPPDDRFAAPRTPRGRTPIDLYRAAGIRITNEAFIVGGRHFTLGELTQLHTARGPHHPLTVRAVVVTGAMLTGIGVALGYTTDLYDLPPAAYLALGVAAFVPMALAALGHRWRPPAYELWGRYRGAMLLLFSSDQERQFGQVTRALIRAREASRLGGLSYPLASANPWEPMQ